MKHFIWFKLDSHRSLFRFATLFGPFI